MQYLEIAAPRDPEYCYNCLNAAPGSCPVQFAIRCKDKPGRWVSAVKVSEDVQIRQFAGWGDPKHSSVIGATNAGGRSVEIAVVILCQPTSRVYPDAVIKRIHG